MQSHDPHQIIDQLFFCISIIMKTKPIVWQLMGLTRACFRSSWTFQCLSGPRLRTKQDSVRNTISSLIQSTPRLPTNLRQHHIFNDLYPLRYEMRGLFSSIVVSTSQAVKQRVQGMFVLRTATLSTPTTAYVTTIHPMCTLCFWIVLTLNIIKDIYFN